MKRSTMATLLPLLFWLTDCHLVAAFSVSANHPRHFSFSSQFANEFGLTHHRTSTSLSSSSGGDETAELLEKARRFREEAESLEITKREAQQLVQQQQDAEKKEEQQKRDAWKDRYSVVVPILKDMGEEVLERVDFSPRIKGGEFLYDCVH